MRIFLPALLIVALAGGVVYSCQEAAAAGQRAERLRDQLAGLRGSLATATAQLERSAADLDAAGERVRTIVGDRTRALATLAKTQASWDAARRRVSFLEKDLRTEVSRRKNVDQLIEQTAAARRRDREKHNAEIWQAKRFMPEGVRQALVTANKLLIEDGQLGLRFLKAMKIEDHVLHDVQLLDRDTTSLAGTIYLADELTFDLDRVRGALTLCFRGGFSRGPYGREEFPLSGKRLILSDINGRRWESRLPFLVEGHGDYPVADKKIRLAKMEPGRRTGWLKRVNDLLARASTEQTYRLDTFRDLEKGKFTQAVLLGYDAKKKLVMSAEADHLCVQVDTEAKTVEIWIEGGTLRKRGGETAIPESGYRIRLHGIEPGQALEAMLGMVKRK
jgi:hypothetical protein